MLIIKTFLLPSYLGGVKNTTLKSADLDGAPHMK